MAYTCRSCHYSQDVRWDDRCPGCGGLYRPVTSGMDGAGRSTFAKATDVKIVRVPSGVEGFDKAMGGGLVAGTSVLFGGQHGAGKSTLACMVIAAFAEKYQLPCLYASAEESVEGVLSIVQRTGCETEHVVVIHEGYLPKVLAEARKLKSAVTVIDSFNRFAPTVPDEKIATRLITKYVRESKSCVLLINQMTKEGSMKGTTEGSHGFDVVLLLGAARPDDKSAPAVSKNCDPFGMRVLYTDKNRRASLAMTYWEMSNVGVMTCVPARKQKPVKGKRGRATSDGGDGGGDGGAGLRREPS